LRRSEFARLINDLFEGIVLRYFHYGKREHIEAFFRDGSIQIGTVRSYDVDSFGSMIGDDDEGFSREVITDDNFHELLEIGADIPRAEFGVPFFGSVGSTGNCIINNYLGFNYAIFCVSRCLHRDLCLNFSPEYDAAIYIDRPFPFFSDLTMAFKDSGLVEECEFQHVADISYQSRDLPIGGSKFVIEAFVKATNYAHQFETRAIWNIGLPQEKFYRFKAPLAARCCSLVLLEDMPDYSPGSSQDVVQQQTKRALRITI